MVHSPSAYTQDTVANTDDDALTQASFPPGPSRQSQHGDDEGDERSDLGSKKSDNVEQPTVPSSNEAATRTDEMKIHCSNNTVSWTDENGDLRNTDSLDLEIIIDNTANRAFLRLCGDVYIKSSKPPNRRAIYLYIRPEVIKFITYHNENNARSLCFSLQSKPDLITPKEPINAKPRSKALLDAIVAISTVTDFVVRLNSSDTTPSSLLKKVASIFSPRPTWNTELGNLSGLYAGKGGQIANASTTASTPASSDLEAQSPPPYRSASKKRKRDIPDIESKPCSAKSDMPPINVMLSEMEQRIMDSIRQLGEKLVDVDPCRYDTEEREDILAEVTQRCDDEFIDLKVESNDVIEEVKEEVERVLNQVDDDAKERMEVIEDELDEKMKSIAEAAAEAAAEKYVKETLLNASWRMDGAMSLQRQI
ncbi:hypothetical protein BBK36DRAFT_1159286 [Trichoderma citrinoviride]|uniref:Uncharacterized protein n=1 Tax=Trichoderma citrinoviride TaxID=58853 RepID=A0A2T4BAK2_9HYPO|nr:hypothetical protein BBK36DRAFT_1159286 [Trichoderma citrinoviride]PTB66239.1 hypothetical protein BBK36DRAFT_1159286 [Trichoderma citrinoviride]